MSGRRVKIEMSVYPRLFGIPLTLYLAALTLTAYLLYLFGRDADRLFDLRHPSWLLFGCRYKRLADTNPPGESE